MVIPIAVSILVLLGFIYNKQEFIRNILPLIMKKKQLRKNITKNLHHFLISLMVLVKVVIPLRKILLQLLKNQKKI